jgi:hypothetical protein
MTTLQVNTARMWEAKRSAYEAGHADGERMGYRAGLRWGAVVGATWGVVLMGALHLLGRLG